MEDNDLTNHGIPRAVRMQMRKPFPLRAPNVAEVDFATLAAWHRECGQQRMLASAWTLNGFRWRRAARRVSHEYSTRLLSHTGVTPGVCDQCQMHSVTHHVAYEPMEAPRFAHFCGTCAPNMPPGWMAVAMFNVSQKVNAAS